MPVWVVALMTVITAVGASSGFWAYLQSRDTAKSASTQLLMGLARDRIIHLGSRYIEQGWLTRDEYEDLETYLYNPYKKFGGNGLAKRIMEEVARLPFYDHRRIDLHPKKEDNS